MSSKSNKEICDFYKGRSRDEVTLKYFKIWKVNKNAKNNAYLGLYEDFNNFSEDFKKIEACEKKDNVSLYRVLQAWKEPERASFPIEIYGKKLIYLGEISNKCQLPDLDFLKNIDIDILNPANNSGGKANQKWHLYVAVFAYSVICQDYSKYKVKFSRMKEFKWNDDFKEWTCHILRLWMIENAEDQQDDLKEIEEAIDRGEKELIKKLIDNAFKKII